MFSYPNALAVLSTPQLEVFLLLFASSKKEDASLGIFLDDLIDNLLHQSRRIYLTLVRCKWSNTYPLLEALFWSEYCRQQIHVSAFSREDGMEMLQVNGIAQTLKDCCVVLE